MNFLDAIKAGDADRVKALLDEDGRLVDGRTSEGVSYIAMAMYHRQPAIASMLAERKAQLDVFESCAVGDRDRVADILASDPGAGDSYSPDGFTPIALAAYFSRPEIVELLANAGVDVNAQARNPMKVAAIHAAVAAGDSRSVEILLRFGADPNLRQQNDYTPLQGAEANADETIIAMLKGHGAR